jgi:hypothetical protein
MSGMHRSVPHLHPVEAVTEPVAAVAAVSPNGNGASDKGAEA